MSDSQLIESTLTGDSAAFGQLVHRYQDRLYNTLVYVMGDAEDARDVAQDAFVKAFVKLDTFQQTSAFYTWLYRIAFNLSVTHRRRTRPTLSLDQTLAVSGEEPVDNGSDPAAETEEGERRERLWVAINELNEEYRTVLILREIEGCRYEAISEILSLPIGTIRSRLHRARAQLREKLKGDWSSED